MSVNTGDAVTYHRDPKEGAADTARAAEVAQNFNADPAKFGIERA